ncbi:TadE/TadG family type IV pilus assembly protein [Massilia sp. TSP1-1-2]|uniref:TadE/TadG family type IV pilus assembly protein n=1 Tax=unclassified Massilia TaxID=2609279 RepID=UPI003CF65086
MNTPSHVVKSMKRAPAARQAGSFLLEFALLAMFFFVLVFTILEVARGLYMWNTLQEVTRRAARSASVTDFNDAAAMNALRQAAVFRDGPGELALGKPITDKHIRIDYMSMQHDSNSSSSMVSMPAAAMPSCPARNRVNCAKDNGDASCIRLIRVRICQPGGSECTPVPYEPLFPLVKLPMNYPVATTIVRAESLGYVPGSALCN